jgi:hypothetical protein
MRGSASCSSRSSRMRRRGGRRGGRRGRSSDSIAVRSPCDTEPRQVNSLVDWDGMANALSGIRDDGVSVSCHGVTRLRIVLRRRRSSGADA